jgi:hypothetical protein
MRIGFDFDNTIVSYNRLFHKIAREQDAIPDGVPVNKLAVRDYLRAADRENIWTEMQGYVYGARMGEAEAYPNVIPVMLSLKKAGHTLAIISHKTKHPYLGKQYDLHNAARGWIHQSLIEEGELLIPDEHIFFELTQNDKLERIGKFDCDVFIDDLPEIFLAEAFPAKAKRFLFDPEENHRDANLPNINRVASWANFESHLL